MVARVAKSARPSAPSDAQVVAWALPMVAVESVRVGDPWPCLDAEASNNLAASWAALDTAGQGKVVDSPEDSLVARSPVASWAAPDRAGLGKVEDSLVARNPVDSPAAQSQEASCLVDNPGARNLEADSDSQAERLEQAFGRKAAGSRSGLGSWVADG